MPTDQPREQQRRGRPSKHPDQPIKVPLPFKELVGDILKAGPHPVSAAKKKAGTPRKAKKGRRTRP